MRHSTSHRLIAQPAARHGVPGGSRKGSARSERSVLAIFASSSRRAAKGSLAPMRGWRAAAQESGQRDDGDNPEHPDE